MTQRSSVWNLVCNEPYRLLFPLGVLLGVVGVGHWFLFAMGLLPSYSAFFHSSFQVELYMASFVFGFLLTALPRFLSAPALTRAELLGFLFLIVANVISLSFNLPVFSELSFILLLLFFVRFAVRRFTKERFGLLPVGFVWVPFALLNGIVGSSLLILGQTKCVSVVLINVGKPMLEQGFLLSVVLGIGGFLGPRLMGLFGLFRDCEPSCFDEVVELRKRKIRIHLGCAAILFLSFWSECFGQRNVGYLVRAVVVTYQFIWAGVIPRPPRTAGIFPRLLWVSFWMIVMGSWSAAIFPAYRTTVLHLMFLGGFSWMTFFVASMVILNHAGEPEKLTKPIWIFWFLATGLSAALFLRLAAVHFAERYFLLLAIASAFWVLTSIGWLYFVSRYLLRIPKRIVT